ncbi:MAG: hypothetical protein E6J39_00860 [Chloroflexi bacterium]|nr:MAG: hypothetical protein E6J39_00860 [Chloroflexota bacterium]
MSGFFEAGGAGTVATWLAVLVTLGVWSYLIGERRLLRISQLLLAGLATGYLSLIAIREVLIPQLIKPLAASSAHLELVLDLLLVAVLVAGRWLPRRVVAVPAAILVGGTVGYALGGAVTGTLLPQLAAGMAPRAAGPGDALAGAIGVAITVPVLLSFLHGVPRGRLLTGAATTGRWLMLGGLGAWFGFLLLSRLALLVDRIGFLLGDWLGVLR